MPASPRALTEGLFNRRRGKIEMTARIFPSTPSVRVSRGSSRPKRYVNSARAMPEWLDRRVAKRSSTAGGVRFCRSSIYTHVSSNSSAPPAAFSDTKGSIFSGRRINTAMRRSGLNFLIDLARSKLKVYVLRHSPFQREEPLSEIVFQCHASERVFEKRRIGFDTRTCPRSLDQRLANSSRNAAACACEEPRIPCGRKHRSPARISL
jgi:hypothetical protein